MPQFYNPLEGLLPKELVTRIWTDATLSESDKVTILVELIERTFKAYTTQLHTDRYKGDAELMADLTLARQGIDVPSLPALVKWYLGENAEAEAYARRLAAQQRRRQEQVMPAFHEILGTTDPRLLLGPGRHEILANVNTDAIGTLLCDFVLLRQVDETSGLFDVSLANVEGGEEIAITSIPKDFSVVDETWQFSASSAPYDADLKDLGEPTTHRIKEHPSSFQVRLAGLMEKKDFDRQRQALPAATVAGELEALHSGAESIQWITPENAWWLPALRIGEAELGDLLVLATPNAMGNIALGGCVIAMRRLDEPSS